ncbi:MAG: tandem-95 repeat protein [Planctomycetales bacterium]|nr:tandem-95 repeat protein [Planctomycetales bacterium]
MTRREKRNRFSQWLRQLFTSSDRGVCSRRSILVEPLESRQLLAADGVLPLLGSSYSAGPSGSTSGSVLAGEGELSAEGEDANDLVAFAKALADSGTRFFGAAWCPFCTEQKQLFQDGYKYLPFIEVTNPDRTPNDVGITENITEYPTWEFPDGTRLTGVQTLATLAARAELTIPQSSTPSMAALSDVSVGIGSPLHIPIDAYDPNGNPLTISVTSSNPSLLTAQVLSGNPSLRLSTQGFGDMVFELFQDRAPVPVGRVVELANDGFYDGVTFHRVINNFVIQGGDPTGTGSGGSTLGDFDDQFHLDLQHNRTGVLSFAKSSDDTNDSQFFITEGAQRFLDFNHSVFGQLVEGEPVREAISNTSTNASDRPTNNVVINSATVFNDTENGVVMLKATGTSTGTATITVTITDSEGNSTSQAFQATVVADSANGAPFLNPVPDVQTAANTPVNVNLTSQDAEGDTVTYSVSPLGTTTFGLTVDSSTGVATVTPPAGFVGELQFIASVRQTTTPTTSSPDDNQLVTVIVAQSVPTAIDLLAASDTGNNSDNITSAQTLVFSVSGTSAGSTVQIRSGGNVVGSAIATGTVTEVTVSNVIALGQGSTLFTATQTSNGQTSGESPSLAVILDSTPPLAVSTAGIPSSAIVDTQLSVDLQHVEEGQGLTYSLTAAPSGMTVGSQDGVLAWTPNSAQLGNHVITLTLTDAAGNEFDQDITINVIEEPLVKIILNAVDMSGAPISTIATGETFKIQFITQDLRSGVAATGVFAAYADVTFDSNIIEPIATNPITYNSPYDNTRSGSTTTAGLVDELGAFSINTLDGDEHVVAEVTFLAKAPGNPNLRTDAADVIPQHHILLFDETTEVPLSRVDFGTSNFAVGANFELVNDSFNFDEDSGTHTLNVLSNDTVTGGAVLTITDVGTASGGGAVTIATDGKTLGYTPAADFSGAESFTYTVENQDGVSRTATVTVQVTDVNDPPLALNDTFSVFRNSSQNVLEVLANDTSGVDESSADTLTVVSVSAGSAGGTVVLGPSGLTLRYTPANGFQGTETFTYTLSDGRGGTDTATVSVSVELSNPPPTPQNDSFTINEDTALATYDVLANDTTNDSTETLSVSGVGTPSFGGTASVSSDGLSIQYRPAPNFAGTEIFTYTLRDSGGATADGLVTFTVNPVNDAPDAVNDTFVVAASEPTTSLMVLDNDNNVDSGETLQIIAVSQPPTGNGTVSISSDGSFIIYTPPSTTHEASFSFTYTIDDGTGLTDTATVAIDVNNYIPRNLTGRIVPAGLDGAAYGIAGVQLDLFGTDITGAPVSYSTHVASDGSYAFDSLAPGNYTLQRAALPFLHDSGSSIAISSAATDGDMVSDLIVSGGLRPEFFDIRDFLGSTARNSLTVAINADGSQAWLAQRGDWSQLQNVNTSLNTSSLSLAVSAVNASQQNLTASYTIGTDPRTYVVGQSGGTRLVKVVGSIADVGLVSSGTSTAAGEGESTLQAEGEASSAVPAIDSIQTGVAFVNSQPSDSMLSSANSSPTLQGVLGSSYAPSSLSAEAVDSAMAAVAPAMTLQLGGELEQTLLSDSDELLEANDQLLSQL